MQLPPEIASFNFHSRLGYVALQAFFKISENWNMTVNEQCSLLKVGLIELERLRQLPPEPLQRSTLIRIRCIVLIYRATIIDHNSVSKANRRLRTHVQDRPFRGKTPLQAMTQGGIVEIATVCKALAGEVPEIEPPEKVAS